MLVRWVTCSCPCTSLLYTRQSELSTDTIYSGCVQPNAGRPASSPAGQPACGRPTRRSMFTSSDRALTGARRSDRQTDTQERPARPHGPGKVMRRTDQPRGGGTGYPGTDSGQLRRSAAQAWQG